MNITSVKDQFNQWKKEANQAFSKTKKEVDSLVEPIQRNLEVNTIVNIPQDFGKFLYTCLGERVTGQRSSQINQDWLNSDHGKKYVELAKEKKCTIEEYLENHDYSSGYTGNKTFRQTQAYITAGRKFGVSYVTGSGDRSHTIFFEEGTIFTHLTQQHVDCVLNKAKKECTQKFLDYRNQFVSELNTLNTNNVLDINVPVKVAKLGNLSTSPLFRDGYSNREGLSAVVIEEIYDDVIKSATIATPTLELWDRVSRVNFRESSRGCDNVFPCMTIQFGSILGAGVRRTTAKKTKFFCNVDIAYNGFTHTVKAVENENHSPLLQTQMTSDLLGFNDIINASSDNSSRYYNRQEAEFTDGVVMNMEDLIKHPAVAGEIQKRVDFFTSKSKELMDLKHAHAGLYFLNEG